MPGTISQSNPAQIIDAPRLIGVWRRLARVTWLILAAAALGILVASLPGYGLKISGQLSHISGAGTTAGTTFFGVLSGLSSLASVLLSLTLAWMFFRRRFDEPAAVSLSFYLLVYAVVMAGPMEAWSAYRLGDTSIAESLQAILLALPTVALFLLFPNGRFVPSWTRWVLLLAVPWNISLFFLPGFDGASFTDLSATAIGLMVLWYASFLGIGLYAQFYRYRRVSSRAEKQQTKWVIFGFSLWLSYIVISSIPYYYISSLQPGTPTPWWVPASEFGWFLALNIVPVSLTVAVSRYRLWDIDLVINRALVYGALTACVIGIYALVVGGASALFQTQGNWLVALGATGLVAVLFQPLRERLQGWVNKLVYGQRDKPFEVLARLGQRLEQTLAPEMVYPTIVETVAQTLKLPYVALAVRQGDSFDTVEIYGKPNANLVAYPLIYQGEIVGQLQVARRQGDEAFTEADEKLLRSIARQAGAAVHAGQLTADLQRSRQRLVSAREEERRRLRRDLHDGLGPTLAALHLQAGVLRRAIRQDPGAAEASVDELRGDIRTAIDDIRRVVYELRPPILDQLGLAAAVRAEARRYGRQAGDQDGDHTRLKVTVEAPETLPPLPAAVEVAAYRIIQEALANVAHHSGANHCTVRLQLGDALLLVVTDDGVGLSGDHDGGLGLLSMRERAAELGGTCTVTPLPKRGTRVLASLPLPSSPK